MAESRILFEANEVEEEVKGTTEFTFWHCLVGLFGDLKGLASEINAATEAAYEEGGVL